MDGDKVALPELAHVEEKLTVTGDVEDAPEIATLTAAAPYASTLLGATVILVNETFTADTVNVVRVVKVEVVDNSATAFT